MRIFCAVLYLLKNGAVWRTLPSDIPPPSTVRYLPHRVYVRTINVTDRDGTPAMCTQARQEL